MVLVTDTEFYIAVGVLSGVFLITILVVFLILAYVVSIHKQLRQQQWPQGAFGNCEDNKKGIAQDRNGQLSVPNMYGEDPAVAVQTRGSRNPLANQNSNFERNTAVINEIRKELKQANYQQAPTPPLKSETSWSTTPTQQQQPRQPSHVHNMEGKNFFY